MRLNTKYINSTAGTSSPRVQELCESRGGRPGLPVLMSLLVSVDVKQHWTMLTHWSQFVPNMSTRHPRTLSFTSSSTSSRLETSGFNLNTVKNITGRTPVSSRPSAWTTVRASSGLSLSRTAEWLLFVITTYQSVANKDQTCPFGQCLRPQPYCWVAFVRDYDLSVSR